MNHKQLVAKSKVYVVSGYVRDLLRTKYGMLVRASIPFCEVSPGEYVFTLTYHGEQAKVTVWIDSAPSMAVYESMANEFASLLGVKQCTR